VWQACSASSRRNESGASADEQLGKVERAVLNALAKEMRVARLFLNPFRELGRATKVPDWTCYCGVGDEVGEAASTAGDGVGAVVSTVEDGVGEVASGAGNIAPPDMSNLRCLWICNCSGARCL
jgi:hypothetical protein